MDDGPKLLEDVIAPLGRDRFISDYWTKSHLHLSGQKDRFGPLLSWDELNTILEWHSPSPQQLKLYQDGRQVDPQYYIDNQGVEPRLNAGHLITALSQGATLVMDHVEAIVPRVAKLAMALQEDFQAPTIVNLYAGWGRQKALNLHWDPQEVFILQLSGRKHWQVHAPTRRHPMKDDREPPPEPTGSPLWAGILKAGDLLYLPRGYWHLVTPLDEPTLHLSFSLEPPDSADFLRWWFSRLLTHHDLRRYLPLGDGAARQDYFAGLLQVMAGDGQGRDRPGEFLSEWNAYMRARPHVRLPFAPAEQKTPIGTATRVRLAQRDGLFIEREPGSQTARFKVAGRQYTIVPQMIPALQRLSAHDSLAVGELCQGSSDPGLTAALIALLEGLASDGVILKETPQAS